MAYQENKPLPTDRLKDSQADIQANFVSNKVSFDQNHITFDAADTGKHKFIQMPVQTLGPVTSATELALYTKEVTGVPQLFLRRENSGAEYDITSATATQTGTTTLPSGLILKWGITGSLAGNSLTTYAFPVAFPTNTFSVVITGYLTTDGNQLVTITNYTTTGFTVFNRQLIGFASSCSATYFAIGN